VAQLRPVAAVDISACGCGNAVDRTSTEDSLSSLDLKLTVIQCTAGGNEVSLKKLTVSDQRQLFQNI